MIRAFGDRANTLLTPLIENEIEFHFQFPHPKAASFACQAMLALH
jgi:hypothetical protein